MSVARSFVAECRAHPTLWRLVALFACAALGSALPGCIAQSPREKRIAVCQRDAAGPVAQAECPEKMR